MSHHSGKPHNEDAAKALQDAMKDLMGEYPDGRLNDDDAGAVAFAVGVEDGKVIIQFAKQVTWMGMTGDQALGLAQLLLKHAKSAGIKSPLIIQIGG